MLKSLMCGREKDPKAGRPARAAIFPGAWGVVVLPYARECRSNIRWAHLLALSRKGAALMVQEWALGLNGLNYSDGWRLGLVSVDHPCGDSCDACSEKSRKTRKKVDCPKDHDGRPGREEYKPHHNFLFPSIAFHPDGRRRELRYHVEKSDLETLRRYWRWWQESVVLGEKLGKKANVHYQFKMKPKARYQAARYFPRTFPSWPGRSQRLSYYGAFSCRNLNKLPEVKRAKAEKDVTTPQGFCQECGGEVCIVLGQDGKPATVPQHYRSINGPAP